MPVLLPKLALLKAEMVQEVIGIYVLIDQYSEISPDARRYIG